MITISTNSAFDAFILIAVQSIISDEHPFCARGDKLSALARMRSYLAPPELFKANFPIDEGDFSADDIATMKLLRTQCQLLDRNLEELIAIAGDSP